MLFLAETADGGKNSRIQKKVFTYSNYFKQSWVKQALVVFAKVILLYLELETLGQASDETTKQCSSWRKRGREGAKRCAVED